MICVYGWYVLLYDFSRKTQRNHYIITVVVTCNELPIPLLADFAFFDFFFLERCPPVGRLVCVVLRCLLSLDEATVLARRCCDVEALEFEDILLPKMIEYVVLQFMVDF